MTPADFIEAFAEADQRLAPDVASGVLHRGTALAVLFAIRDAVHHHSPHIAELLVPTACEAAVPAHPQPTHDE